MPGAHLGQRAGCPKPDNDQIWPQVDGNCQYTLPHVCHLSRAQRQAGMAGIALVQDLALEIRVALGSLHVSSLNVCKLAQGPFLKSGLQLLMSTVLVLGAVGA